MDQLLKRITFEPKVLAGKPTIRGLRISVEQLLKALAKGVSTAEILREYPELENEDIFACFEYAAQLVGNERVYPVGAS